MKIEQKYKADEQESRHKNFLASIPKNKESRPLDIKKAGTESLGFFGAPSGARTLDPNIKSVVLYQLS